MEIKRNGSQPSTKPSPEYFTGTVRLDPLFQAACSRPRQRQQCHVRARRSHRLAHASARADFDRHCRLRPDAALGRPDRRNPPRRCGLNLPRRKALARRRANHGHDPPRHSRTTRRQASRLAGKGQRRTIHAARGEVREGWISEMFGKKRFVAILHPCLRTRLCERVIFPREILELFFTRSECALWEGEMFARNYREN